MFWSGQDTQSKPLAEKIRQHFLNHNVSSYRSPPVDLDTSSDTSFDLSNSFEQAIQSRRAIAAMPIIPSPSRQEDEDSASESHDASGMCRMLNGLELASGTAFTEKTYSPCKMVGLTRPSTVVEESLRTSRSFCTAFESNDARSEAKFATDGSPEASTNSLNFTRDSLQPVGVAATSQHFEDDSLNENKATTANSDDDLGTLEPTSTDFVHDDTLEDVEYDRNGSKYILRPTRRVEQFAKPISVDSSPEEVILVHDDDSDDPAESSYQTARTHAKTEASDASYEKNIHQPTGPEDLFTSNANRSFYSDDESDEHLSVSMNGRNQSISRKSHVADRSNVISLIDSDSDEDCSADRNMAGRTSAEGQPANNQPSYDYPSLSTNAEFKTDGGVQQNKVDIHTALVSFDDSDASDSKEESDHGAVEHTSNPDARNVLLDVPDIPHRPSEDLEPSMLVPDFFNDTIERMDYMIEHGRRIAAMQSAKKASAPSPLLRTPNDSKSSPYRHLSAMSASAGKASPRQPLFGTPLARDSPILKTKSSNSPASTTKPTNSAFKKPMPIKTTVTPGMQRKPTPGSGSRIPMPVFGSKLTKFDHIRSPIGAYISKTAPNPVRQNVNPTREFLDSTYCAGASKGLDYTLPVAVAVAPPKQRYPKTIYIQALADKIIDKQTIVLPGDANVQKLIGSQPQALICRGMTNRYPPQHDEADEEFFGEAFASFQRIIGDINIHEVYNGKQ